MRICGANGYITFSESSDLSENEYQYSLYRLQNTLGDHYRPILFEKGVAEFKNYLSATNFTIICTSTDNESHKYTIVNTGK